jgi:2-oxoglutarate ferredoxin oxidoreductase subunit alpha
MTIEINYSDNPNAPMITEENRRYAQLAWLLRAQTLVDVDCWSVVYGHPLQPGMIHQMLLQKLAALNTRGDS